MLAITALFFVACQPSNTIGIDTPSATINKNPTIELTSTELNQISLMKEVSLAVGNTMKNKKASSYLFEKIEKIYF